MNSSKHFSVAELSCRCGCGTGRMNDNFLVFLEAVRVELGLPMVVSSAFRCADYNEKLSKSGSRTGPHTTGKAIDIACFGADAYKLLMVASSAKGAQGVGVSQRGELGDRFIHLDTINEPNRPWLWSY